MAVRNGSTRRPLHGAPGEDVEVQVGHGFAAIGAIVDDEAEAVCVESLAAGDFTDFEHEVSEQRLVSGLGETRDGLARDEEQVDGCLWGDVPEADALIVFVDDFGGDFAGADFFE